MGLSHLVGDEFFKQKKEDEIMKSKKNFSWIVSLAIVFTIVLTSWAVHAQKESDLQIIRDRGVLRVGAALAEPLYMPKLGTKEWTGIIPDIMELLAENLGVKLEYVETSWGTAAAGLQSGRFDIIGGFNAHPARALVVDFTRVLKPMAFGVVSLKKTNIKYWSDIDKPEIKLVSPVGAGQTKIMEKHLKKVTWVRVQYYDGIYLELESGRSDFALLDFMAASKYIQARGKGYYIVPLPKRESDTNMAVRKSNPPEFRDWLNITLRWLEQQGDIDLIWNKWSPPVVSSQ